jgi:asparagine synthase (glutamine-hydrolysing)
MCGITGFNWEDQELIWKMTSALQHRGPNSSGKFIDKGISLGHRRLSIIDLSEKGNQPMTSEGITIIFNGEIYDYNKLRDYLEIKGFNFNSKTDSEVILHGYKLWGENVVNHLNGQFAFAIWDSNKKKLFIARDRLGIKPLYYHWDGLKFIFGSEIKSILCDSSIKRKVNKLSARNYLNLRYVPGEETLFEGIKKLLPGHSLTLSNFFVTVKKYWDLPLPKNKKDIVASINVRELLTDSVRRRLVADVPVGVYLSGGLDSSAITAIAAGIKKEAVKTFSVGFNSKFDELNKARKVAEHFNTDHHEIVIDEKICEMLPKILWHLDMPHGDPVIIPQFKLSELASKKVKVVLSGEGADEIFGGYVQYKTMVKAKKIPSFISKSIVKKVPVTFLDKFYDYPSSIGEKGKEKVNDFVNNIKNEEKAYFDLISITSAKDRETLGDSNVVFDQDRKPLLHRMLYHDTKNWMPNYVLHINDRMTMANSIEGRTPFLDHNLVEYVNNLPTNLKKDKLVLRQAMKKILPSQEKKHAFLMPLENKEIKDLAISLKPTHEFFSSEYVKNIVDKYDTSSFLYGKQLFTLLNFELWHRMFIESENMPTKNVELDSLT